MKNELDSIDELLGLIDVANEFKNYPLMLELRNTLYIETTKFVKKHKIELNSLEASIYHSMIFEITGEKQELVAQVINTLYFAKQYIDDIPKYVRNTFKRIK